MSNTPAKRGRPRRYITCMDLDAACEMYFEACDEGRPREVYDKKSGTVQKIIEQTPYTIAGLCRALGFDDRNALSEYDNRDKSRLEGYSSVIKRARARIEEYVSSGMLNGRVNTIGGIFYLKAMHNWRDSPEQNEGGGITVVIEGGGSVRLDGTQAIEQPAIDADFQTVSVSLPRKGGKVKQLAIEGIDQQ